MPPKRRRLHLLTPTAPKKFRSRNTKLVCGPVQPPDCLVVIDAERKSSVLVEAEKLQIPVVALVDSSMPLESFKRTTYPIPANDSVQFIYLFCNMIAKTILSEKKRLDTDRRRKEELLLLELLRRRISLTRLSCSSSTSPWQQILDLMVLYWPLNSEMGRQSINLKNGCNVPLFLPYSTAAEKVAQKELEKDSQSNLAIHTFELNEMPQFSGSQRDSHDLVYATQSVALLSLMNSTTLDMLLSQGKEYALMVDSRNVLATIDPSILLISAVYCI
ncbi:hypothetical protein MLD38_023763 [Melastoma candidum]|uniref:Uncharacterized protein n=1 Tax=Melastoma candidum TaxID=119954 RepID=A0ACB9NQC9_9MYRT|nr:hypothetical protein MLD38_023763 [Melastoma candidum]